MNNLLERSIFLGVVLLSFLCAWRASAKNPVTIHKTFHHTTADSNAIELGSLVFYGTGFELLKPQITQAGEVDEYRFVIPQATLQDGAREQLEEIKKRTLAKTEHGYTMRIVGSKKPDAALTILFTFPRKQCEVSCACINSIQCEKGIVFRVYNRARIEALQKQPNPVLRTALHTPPRIFIDSGHGGDDIGAVSATGITEKEVCLAVSKKVKTELCSLGYTVCMARENDRAVPLDGRTGKARRADVDLVVSIHANAAGAGTTAGTEIFFLEPHFLVHEHYVSSVVRTFLERYYAFRTEENQKLTSALHASILATVPQHNPVFKDRGIKTAISQVLLGAARPAALIEIGFLTHPTEARLLAAANYQSILARAIATGIHRYCVGM